MALRAPVILAPLLLEDHDRSSPALVNDFRRDLCALDQRLADHDALVAVNQPHFAQFHPTADISRETFDLKEGPAFDAILLTACFHYCVHE